METIVTSVVPLFSVIFVGYGAGRLNVVDEAGVRTLVGFVFTFAMPALIFRLMATAEFGERDEWAVPFAYLLTQIPIFLLGLALGAWIFRQTLAETIILAFGSSFSNGVLLALPMVLSIYGEQASVPALLIIMLDIAMFGGVTLLLEIAKLRDRPGSSPRPAAMLFDLARSVVTHPLVLASVLGVTVSLTSMTLPGALDKTLAFLGQAGPPAGLFALGATLGQSRIAGQVKPVTAMIVLKLALHPVLAWLIVWQLFPHDPVAVGVVLLFAACPVGANVYVFAAQYRAGVETSATAILISTMIAALTLSLLLLVGVDSSP